jgi:hypothetical protein
MEYKIMQCPIGNIKAMESKIFDLLELGWELYGSPCTIQGGGEVSNKFIQTLIKK